MTSKRRKSAKTNKLEAFLCPYKFVQQSNQLAHKMRFQNKKTDALGCELFSNFVPLQCFKYLLIIIDTFGAILLFVLTEIFIRGIDISMEDFFLNHIFIQVLILW